jgi:methylthioribose-1-phosphate isomerase
MNKLPETIKWENNRLYIIDQTKLPNELVIKELRNISQVWSAIKKLEVRGAPAIGVVAAYGLLFAVKGKFYLGKNDFLMELHKGAEYLNSSRPTAVNLSWALNRMVKKAIELSVDSNEELYLKLVLEAVKIHEEDKNLCMQIGLNGKKLIKENMGILTHCNAGSLATSELGTATSPMYLAHEDGIKFKVYADETRPLLQGSRLTTWELSQSGVDVTLICDNMAASMMSKKLIDLVIVGADRVAANGDTANKIGTLNIAILANYFKIPFYVACPYSTIDFETKSGDKITIEERQLSEVTSIAGINIAPENIGVRNPAFDVTPNYLISGIITEKTIIEPPFEENFKDFY